ncbi:MAG: transcriptional regulator [Methanomicrobiales archaeon HGW-Methanomicrobiales-4]|nr:MAG: transcriptional regulator [Methanomicrobiales archaeon HGW-Methanomicrobiales-4]
MKLIKAIIKPERLDAVKASLEEAGIFGMTISEVQGRGEQKGISLQYRGGTILVDLIPKVEIELVVSDKISDSVIEAIKKGAYTGKIGDGRIFVLPVSESIKIRTNEVITE